MRLMKDEWCCERSFVLLRSKMYFSSGAQVREPYLANLLSPIGIVNPNSMDFQYKLIVK
jgi:hypothetical protein